MSELLLTPEELLNLKMPDYVKVGDSVDIRATRLLREQMIAQAQLDKVLKPEWKDKPDSHDELWFLVGTIIEGNRETETTMLCISGEDGCTEIVRLSYDKSLWLTTKIRTYHNYKNLKGKWAKALVPEENREI